MRHFLQDAARKWRSWYFGAFFILGSGAFLL